MNFNKGDKVLIQLWGENEHLFNLEKYAEQVADAGGIIIKQHFSRVYLCDQFEKLANTEKPFPDNYFKQFEIVDFVLNLLAYDPHECLEEFPQNKMKIYCEFVDKLNMALKDKPSYTIYLGENKND